MLETLGPLAANLAGGAYLGAVAAKHYRYDPNGWEYGPRTATLQPAPWGGTCKILYEVHGLLTVDEKALDGVDLVTFEVVYDIKQMVGLSVDKILTNMSDQNRSMITNKASSDCQFFAVDVPGKGLSPLLPINAAYGLGDFILRLGIPIGLLNTAPLLAIALLSPLIESLANTTTTRDFGRSAQARALASRIQEVRESLLAMPINFTRLKVRNVIAAEKNEYLATSLQGDKADKVNLASLWGAGHSSIESATLMTSAQRIDFLKRNARWYRKYLAIDDPYLWSAARIEPGKEVVADWVEVPTLRALFTGE